MNLKQMNTVENALSWALNRIRTANLGEGLYFERACALLDAHADTVGAIEAEAAKQAMKAELLADALFVLGMVDKNNRIAAGEPGKAWSGRFVVEEVRRVLAATGTQS